jgi:hypothetical protein
MIIVNLSCNLHNDLPCFGCWAEVLQPHVGSAELACRMKNVKKPPFWHENIRKVPLCSKHSYKICGIFQLGLYLCLIVLYINRRTFIFDRCAVATLTKKGLEKHFRALWLKDVILVSPLGLHVSIACFLSVLMCWGIWMHCPFCQWPWEMSSLNLVGLDILGIGTRCSNWWWLEKEMNSFWYKVAPAVAVMCTCIDGLDWWERLLIHGKAHIHGYQLIMSSADSW